MVHPSHVLQALGRSRQLAEASLRLSLGRSTTEEDVEQAIRVITAAVRADPLNSVPSD